MDPEVTTNTIKQTPIEGVDIVLNTDHEDHYGHENETTNLYVELVSRWKAEIPKFWSQVLKIAIAVGTSAVAVIGMDKLFDLQSYGVPQIVFTMAGYVVVACAAIGLSAKITKQ